MPVHLYVGIQYVPLVVAAMLMLLFEDVAPWSVLAVVAAFALTSILAFGALFERRQWALGLEWFRLAGSGLMLGAALWIRPEWRVAAVLPLLLAGLSMIWVGRVTSPRESPAGRRP